MGSFGWLDMIRAVCVDFVRVTSPYCAKILGPNLMVKVNTREEDSLGLYRGCFCGQIFSSFFILGLVCFGAENRPSGAEIVLIFF
jgi:hypothetical protein